MYIHTNIAFNVRKMISIPRGRETNSLVYTHGGTVLSYKDLSRAAAYLQLEL